MKRRTFIKKGTMMGTLASAGIPLGYQFLNEDYQIHNGSIIKINNPDNRHFFMPLEELSISLNTFEDGGAVSVLDGSGKPYYQIPYKPEIKFFIGGALGYHQVLLTDKKGKHIDRACFPVNCETMIEDENGEFKKLLNMLHWTMVSDQGSFYRYNNKPYYTFMGWFQDHVHVLKAMKYFYPFLKSGIDLYADGQREDGMIFDNYYLPNNEKPFWSWRFNYDGFVKDPGDPNSSSSFFTRTPVENMSEFTFLEGLYFTWKATGDDVWMSKRLDHAIKAIRYGTTDIYRWSKKFNLMKRPYTIDIWDFLPDEEAARFNNDVMAAHPEKSRFGVLFADNIGMAVGCEYVSEMLNHVGRTAEAEDIKKLGDDLRVRTEKLCWNGEFFVHRIEEDPSIKPDFGGTDESRQVTLSNAYVLNKRLDHNKCVSIINTYQRIRKEMPPSSPGEWYMCYPPYEKGWHMVKWEYMNGGVSGITAGELAHGAYEHGFEDYATDILRRIWKLAQTSGNYLNCIYRGAMPEWPLRNFFPMNLRTVANMDFYGKGIAGVPVWLDTPGDELNGFPVGKQEFEKIKFDIIDPATNNRKACLGLSGVKGYAKSVIVKVGQKAKSIYLLHVISGGSYAGNVVWNYADNTTRTDHILSGEHAGSWHFPSDKLRPGWPVDNNYIFKVAWKGKSARGQDTGVYMCGINNPEPDKIITSIEFSGPDNNTKWMIIAASLSDYPVFFMPPHISFGAPDSWAAAAVTYALVEGLAGVKDEGIVFRKMKLSPRWETAGIKKADVVIKYEASGGYVAYKYRYILNENKIIIRYTGNHEDATIDILIPEGKKIEAVFNDREQVSHEGIKIENSNYVRIKVQGTGAHIVEARIS